MNRDKDATFEEEQKQFRERASFKINELQRHVVRLGIRPHEARTPDHRDLSGSGVLLNVQGDKGILTAAHNIRCKFPKSMDDFSREYMDAIIPLSRGNRMLGIPVELVGASIYGGTHEDGDPKSIGPDIAWIPLNPEVAAKFEQQGRVFFHFRDGRFPDISKFKNVEIDQDGMFIGLTTVGFSDKRERMVPSEFGHKMLNVTQDAFWHECEWEEDGWDYQIRVIDDGEEVEEENFVIDKEISEEVRKHIPSRVYDLGGLSGGGIWIVGELQDGQIVTDLVGLIWYQCARREEEKEIRIANHGRKSIERITKRQEWSHIESDGI